MDPVLEFILDPKRTAQIHNVMANAPYSKLSSSRIEKIGYMLICERMKELGVPEPSREQVRQWKKEIQF